MSQFSRTAIFWLVLLFLFMTLYNFIHKDGDYAEEISYSTFLDKVQAHQVSSVVIDENIVKGFYVERPNSVESYHFRTVAPPDDKLIQILRENGVGIDAKEHADQPWYLLLLLNALPILVIIGLWLFFMRQVQLGAGKGMSFGKSKAKLLTEDQRKVTFKDVAGIREAQQEVQEIIEFLKDPKKFTRLGGRIPKGVLLVGPPGTGKTLLARAIAGEAGVPFFSISGSDFVEMFVGVGASRVRDLFIQGKKNAPCIIFIDEIDAVGRHRGAGIGGGHDEREQTLNQLLVEMDGFEGNEGVILIAATNRPDVLDPALLRPGRFDRRVIVHRPDVLGRKEILVVHTRKVPIADDVDLGVIARGTPGFSGAELEILVNEAALYAARQNKSEVHREDFEYAKDKVMMGAERRSMLLSAKEKETTAYHESGHALVAKMLPNADPVHKLTVVPRGMALGLMQQLPENDKHTYSRSYWLDQLAVFFGGRVAELEVFGEMNTGAASDIERATEIARRMVREWGMSEKLGPVQYAIREGEVFLGKEMGRSADFSERVQEEIDSEVRRILDEQYKVAERIVREHIDALHRLAKSAIERETLNAEEIDLLLADKELPPMQPPVQFEPYTGADAEPPTEEKSDEESKEGAVAKKEVSIQA